MRKALWVVRDRVTTAGAIDDLLEDAATRGIFDLVVQVGGRATEDLDPLDRLVRYGAAVGVRIHAWASASEWEDIVRRYRVEGLHCGDAHVTVLVRESAARARAVRSGVVISATVPPDPRVAREWAAEGLVDVLCPMAYRTDSAEVARVLTTARAAAPNTEMWGGLMAYAGEPARLGAQVRAAKDAGCQGAILFAYDPAQRELLDVFARS